MSKKLSKKERKALEAREVELATELARREKKAAKKKAKKAGKKKGGEVTVDTGKPPAAPAPSTAEERAAKSPTKSAKTKVIEAADSVTADSSEGAKIAAKTAKAAAMEAGDGETDEQIKARVKAKRARRAELEALAESIDREDAAAVKAYNEELASLGGGHFLTSTAELDKEAERLANDPLNRHLEPKPETVAKVEAAVEALKAEVVELETEQGREFVAGVEVPGTTDGPAEAIFAKPSEAPRVDFDVNGNGQYKVKRPSDGKVVGYTRVTTYIACLEERTMLEKWKLRMLLEGVSVNDTEPAERGEVELTPVAATMADLTHRRDVTIAKARKADRKGKLALGELGTITERAWSEFKKATNALAEELLELGGAHEKAQKGTDLHALTELYDREGIDAVGDLLTEGKITPADLADVEAYADAIKRAGIKIIPEHIEQVIVNDELKVAGRLDRVVLARFPGNVRAVRCVLDLKTGRVDLGAGKIAQQCEMYAGGEGYDLNTHERTDLKLSRTKAILVHLPAGSGKATIHPVDLTLGRRGNKLAGEVRAWRNEGKRAIDFDVDMAQAAPHE